MSLKALMPPELQADLDAVFGAHWDTFGVELTGLWVARGTAQYQNFKRLPLLAKYFLTSGTKHQPNQSRKRIPVSRLLVVKPKVWQVVFIFLFKAQG